ncbi:hypothetical protein ACN2A0_02400 [Aerococcus viridans]
MKKIYGLQNDKEIISLIIADDKPLLIIQTAESFKVRELKLQYDNEDLEEITTVKFKPINISADKITTGTLDAGKVKLVNLDGTGEKIEIRVGELRTQTTFLMSKVDYLETKLKEKDEEISKLKDLTNTKVSSEEFWDFMKYYTEESDALAEVEPIDITEYYKDETQQKEQPEPVQRALKRIKELNRVTDVRIDEEFKPTDFDMTENKLTITIDYLDADTAKKMKKAGKCKLD